MILDDADLYHLRPRRAGENGGEWDMVRSWPRKVRRQLTGTGHLGNQYGIAPDQLAHDLAEHHGLNLSTCDALDLWRRELLRILAGRRREQHQRRHLKVARRAGFATYYEYRTELYRQRGAESVHAYALACGWRTPVTSVDEPNQAAA